MSILVGTISRATLTPHLQRCVLQETITAWPIIMGTMLASTRSTRHRALGFPALPGGSTLKRAIPGILTWSRIRTAYKVSMTLWWLMARQRWVSIARQRNGKALPVGGTIPGHRGARRRSRPRNKRRPIVLDTSLPAARAISCNTCLPMQSSIMMSPADPGWLLTTFTALPSGKRERILVCNA